MTQRPGDDEPRDDRAPEGEEDELFAAVTAAVSQPRRRVTEPVAEQAEAPEEVSDDEPQDDPEAGLTVEPQEELLLDDPVDDAAEADEPAEEPAEEPADDPEPTIVAPAATTRSPYDDLFGPPAADTEQSSTEDFSTEESSGDGGSGDGDAPDTDEQGKPRRRGRKVLLGVVAVLALAYVGGYFLTGLRMPANASVAGVDVSGSSPADARDELTRVLTPRTERPILLQRGETDFRIDPDEAGMTLDVDASVRAAGGERSWDPRDMAALVFGEHPHDAVVDTEPEAFDAALGTIAEAVDQEVVEAQISFPKAKPTPREPKAGEVVDRVVMTRDIKRALVGDGEPIDVVTKVVQPAVDQAGLDEAMQGIGQTAVSGPVAIEVGDQDVELPVTAYAPALVIRVEDRELKPYIDPEELAAPLTSSTSGIGKKAVDATVRIEDGKPVVVPGKEGVGLQPQEMAVKLLPAIAATGAERAVQIEAKVVEPAFTTEDAEALKITEKVGEFETQFPYAEYRNTNQGRAAEILDGTIIKPGETFSFNDIVGERTQANGFVTGTVINGGVFREELGGGVSQVATTMYNAAFFGGMDDVEHHPHAFFISRYPAGREATVYFGNLDLRWKNSTDYGVLIRATVDKSAPGKAGTMRVELWSTKVWDKVEAGQSGRRNARTPSTQYDESNRCVAQAPVAGFDIDIYRTFYRDGKKVKTETDRAVYQAADRVVCGKKPEPKPAADEDDTADDQG